jgi:hypothetical protein
MLGEPPKSEDEARIYASCRDMCDLVVVSVAEDLTEVVVFDKTLSDALINLFPGHECDWEANNLFGICDLFGIDDQMLNEALDQQFKSKFVTASDIAS